MNNNKKQTGRGAWRAPALLFPLALLSGCTLVAPERPTVYANWMSHNVRSVSADSPYPARLPSGEDIQLAKLSDGHEAIALTCGEVPGRANESPFDLWRSARPSYSMPTGSRIDKTAAEAEQWIAEREARVWKECTHEALRICRVKTWNGNSTFALMDGYNWLAGGHKTMMFVRCLTPDAFKRWAMSLEPGASSEWAVHWCGGPTR